MCAAYARRVFSGIQPTGIPHLGNYLGAIRNWVHLQKTEQKSKTGVDSVMFCVMDLHSSTVLHHKQTMHTNVRQMLAALLACGIDPQKCLLFQQSQVPEHAHLAWILGCLAQTGRLDRMHQWKSKSAKIKDGANLGIFAYPVLMSADILLYKSTHVPVGDDQTQHMELTRDLATTFNKTFAQTFPIPETILTKTPRLSSLRRPTEKMSKSEPNPNSRIDITDDADTIARKIKKAVTDSEPYITYDLTQRPGVRCLVEILSSLTTDSRTEVIDKYRNVEYFTRQLKSDVTDVLVDTLQPICLEYEQLQNENAYLQSILNDDSLKARQIAENTLKEVHENLGYNIL